MEIKCRAFTKKWGMVYIDDPELRIDVHLKSVIKSFLSYEEDVDISMATGIILGAKEVYAGDIVRSICDYNGEVEQIAIVEMDHPTDWGWGTYGHIETALSYNEKTEIIGNIWENPELVASAAEMNEILEDMHKGERRFRLARNVRS